MKTSHTEVKVVLIQPITLFTKSFNFKNTVITHLLKIATCLKNRLNRYPVKIEVVNLIDEEVYRPTSINEYPRHIRSLKTFFDRYNNEENLIFGISCFSSNFYISTLALAKLLRKDYPKSLICVGGYQVNYFPEEFVFPKQIESESIPLKLFDYIFLGEADYVFAEVIKRNIDRGDITSQSTEECKIVQCGLVDNIEQLPFIDYSLLKIPHSPFLFVPIYFSLGCPFNCKFCGDFRNIYKPKKRWRFTSPTDGFSRLKHLIKYYSDKDIQIQIFDPLWTYPEWRLKFYNLLLKENIAQDFWAEIRIDQFSLKELDYLKNLNFTLAFGLESGDPQMLRIMNKTSHPKKYLSRFEILTSELNSAEIYVICNILLGHPGETANSLCKTSEYIERISKNLSNFLPSVSKYMLIPGSDIYNEQQYYQDTFQTRFYYPHYWTIPKNSQILSGMVDPSKNLTYMDIIRFMSIFIPDLEKKSINTLQRLKNRYFIFQRYLNKMIFGSRNYWKKEAVTEYNTFGAEMNPLIETKHFWRDVF
ncbi:MAG: radical SAM protein [Candidatus Lokiarchaeota archaeon]|nr:radical SAM protein [Candidatus Lokiarchaeota archaeon]